MNLNMKNLPLLPVLAGCLALLLRAGLYLLGTDEKGLLIPWHVLDILCWAVTVAALVVFSVNAVRLKGSSRYQDNFSPSLSAALGALAMAAGIAVSTLTCWEALTRLILLRNLCGLLAVPALIRIALCRRQGRQPFFGCHGITCLYLTLYSVSHYQTWCSQPQLQDYAFSMAGALLLALFGYYQTAFDAGLGRRRLQLFVGLTAAYFCLAALPGTEDVLLYLCGTIWTLTNLCSLTPVTRRPNPFTENAHEAA